MKNPITVTAEIMKKSMTAPDLAHNWDRLGVVASALCMVHCIALPVAFALLPALAAYDGVGDYTHVLFGVVLVGISLFSFVPGYRQHRTTGVPALAAAGLALVLAGAFGGHALAGESGETVLTVAGSVLLIAAHVRNRALCVRCRAAVRAVET
jgi:hypothetical protein